ncbi:unnamed protein product, partial [Didymodactylos carnosus]
PDEHSVSCTITKMDNNKYEITYTPEFVGEYHIQVFHNENEADGSPYVARAFDVNKVEILAFPTTAIVGSATYFTIEATHSGSGNLEIAVSRNQQNIPNYVTNEGGARFRVKFTPEESGVHKIIIFIDLRLLGSPFACNALSTDFILNNFEKASINKKNTFFLTPRKGSQLHEKIDICIISPSEQAVESNLERLPNRSYAVHFTPNEIVNTTGSGDGELLVNIEQGVNKISHEQIRLLKDLHQIVFVPKDLNDCMINITFNGENTLGTLKLSVVKSKEVYVSPIDNGIVGNPITFTIDIEDDNGPLVVKVTESGHIVPNTIVHIERHRYEVTFIPTVSRTHEIEILYNNHPISTTPLKCEVFNISKIKVGTMNAGNVGRPFVFSVDTHGAGEGHLEVTITDGLRTLPAELKSIQARKFDIAFLPKIPQKHFVEISFNGMPIDGSPFIVKINERINDLTKLEEFEDEESDDLEKGEESELIIGGQVEGTKCGELVWLLCSTPLTDIYDDLDAFVVDPHNIVTKHTRIQDKAGRWRIEFLPEKSGKYQIQALESDIDDTPITLASVDILPFTHDRKIEGLRIIVPNKDFIYIINEPESDPGIILKKANGDVLPLKIEELANQLKVHVSLEHVGLYQLSIIENGDENLYDIYCIEDYMEIFRNGGINDITRMIIDKDKVTEGDINVIVKDPTAHTIPAAFYRNDERDLIIEYVPTHHGIHEVFIRSRNNLMDFCPIRIMAFTSESFFEPALRVQIKETIFHTVKKISNNEEDFNIVIVDPFGKHVLFQKIENENGDVTISLTILKIGTHWLTISSNNRLQRIPIFAFDDDYVAIEMSPTQTPVVGETQPLSHSQLTSIDTQPFSSTNHVGKDLTTISETSEVSSTSLSSPKDKSVSRNLLNEIITEPSSHAESDKNISDNDKSSMVSPIPQKPLLSSPPLPSPPPLPEQTVDRPKEKELVLEITGLVDPVLYSTSNFILKDNDNLTVAIYDANDNNIAYYSEHYDDGRTEIFYRPLIIGPVEIHVFKNNQPIQGSPLTVNAFDPSAVTLIGVCDKTKINSTYRFLLDPTKAGKGPLKVIVKDTSNSLIPVTISKTTNGQVAVEFVPISPGTHTISVNFNKHSVPNTPFTVNVLKDLKDDDLVSLPNRKQQQSIYGDENIPN